MRRPCDRIPAQLVNREPCHRSCQQGDPFVRPRITTHDTRTTHAYHAVVKLGPLLVACHFALAVDLEQVQELERVLRVRRSVGLSQVLAHQLELLLLGGHGHDIGFELLVVGPQHVVRILALIFKPTILAARSPSHTTRTTTHTQHRTGPTSRRSLMASCISDSVFSISVTFHAPGSSGVFVQEHVVSSEAAHQFCS